MVAKYTRVDACKACLRVELDRIEGDLFLVVRYAQFPFDQQWLCGEIEKHILYGNSLSEFNQTNKDTYLASLAEYAEIYVQCKARVTDIKDDRVDEALTLVRKLHKKVDELIRPRPKRK